MGKKGTLNNWRTDDGEYSRKTSKRCDKNRYRNDPIRQRQHINHHNYGDNHSTKDGDDEPENETVFDNETTFINVTNDRRSALKLERKIQRQRKYGFGEFYDEDDVSVATITKQLPVSLIIEVKPAPTTSKL